MPRSLNALGFKVLINAIAYKITGEEGVEPSISGVAAPPLESIENRERRA
jgi:hypothetical protein